MDDIDARAEELTTLQAIYQDSISIDAEQYSGVANVPIVYEDGVTLRLLAGDGSTFRSAVVQHLPPMVLSFSLPDEYPDAAPPKFTLRSLVVPETAINDLNKKLSLLWDDMCGQVLFSMIDELHEAAQTPGHLVGSVIDCGEDVKYDKIIEFDQNMQISKFNEATFTCDICQRDLKGAQCLRFEPCEHTFCNTCLKEFFTSLIEGGDVEKVHCPDFECSKTILKAREKWLRLDTIHSEEFDFELFKLQLMTPAIKLLLLQLILGDTTADRELYQRFLSLYADHQHAIIAKMFPTRLVSCPRSKCPAMIFRENTASRLVICRVCDYAFCNICRKSYHSDSIDCSKSRNTKEYAGIPKDSLDLWLEMGKESKERNELRLRYGFDLMTKVANEYLMDKLFDEMLADETQDFTKCPTCEIVVQRLDGCNKMKCSSCYSNFCNLCGLYLDMDKPYDHFNDPKSTCYGKLFAGMPGI